MQKSLLLAAGAVAFLMQSAFGQVVYNESWENTSDGWGTIGGNMVSEGFSTTLGVTEGSYSLILGDASTATSGPNYAGQWGSAASTALTADLANASSITLDVYVPSGDFGGFLQWDLALSQNGGLGYQSVDGYNYHESATIGAEAVLTWTIPSSEQAILAANPTDPTSLNFQIGGGFTSAADAVYLDDLTITDVPEPTTMALCGLGMAGLVALRRRKV